MLFPIRRRVFVKVTLKKCDSLIPTQSLFGKHFWVDRSLMIFYS